MQQRQRGDRDRNGDSFAEHYLKHVAVGEGCNCAESVLRSFSPSPINGDSLEAVGRALRTRLAGVLERLQMERAG